MTAAATLVLHGGAGVTRNRDYAPVERHLAALATEGRSWLAAGVAAIDIVERAVGALEASGLYVAGRGSGPNRAGRYELDAAIMDGARMRAGAVAAIGAVESPVAVARQVLERTPHILIAGEGADRFAGEIGARRIADPAAWFRIPVGVLPEEMTTEEGALAHGTVGAVALDRAGRLAAATSTGGLFGKRPGRVGDTPIIGAGCWADDRVAVSCTGVGEMFVLAGGGHEVAARMRLAGQPVAAAAAAMLDRVRALGGDGGAIALSADGSVAMPFNSAGMKRAVTGIARTTEIYIY